MVDMDRRSVIRSAAAGAVGGYLSQGWAAGKSAPSSPVTTALVEYMAAAASRELPAEVAEHAKHHLLDTLAAILSGSGLPPGKAGLRYVKMHGGRGSATIIGSDASASAADAAFANGMSAHADETDDSHNVSRSHPGASTIPAALAVGEELGISGKHLLRAITLGYDVGTRVLIAMGGQAFSFGSSLSSHSICGTFCSAAAAGCGAGLDAQQMRWLLDYTAQQSSGLYAWRRDTDHIEKAFVFAGMPARNGVTSALVVRAGWNGIDDIFSGADNFFQAYAPKAQPEKLAEKLGERYEIALTDIKKWTVGSPIQGPLDALDAMRSKRSFEAADVQRVVVRLAPPLAAVVDNRDIPDICVQHMVAVMLLDKTASFQAAHDKARMQDTAILRERAKVQLVPDAELSKFLPARVAVVEVLLADGTQLSERVAAVRGTFRNPMSRPEIVTKARDLIHPVIGREKGDQLIESVYAMEGVGDVRSLKPLLRPDNAS